MSFAAVALAVALGALSADVTIRPLAGQAVTGQLVELTVQHVVVRTKDGPQTLPAADLMFVELSGERVSTPTGAWIDLVDGSRLAAESYTVAAGKAVVVLVGGLQIEVPTRWIDAVRFRQQDADLAEQWQGILAAQRTSDLIVVRKTSSRAAEEGGESKTVNETALDELDGTLLDVAADNVQFDFGGERIAVKREKIEGLLYFHAVRRELPTPLCRLIDAGGSHWSLKSVELKGSLLSISTVAGVVAEVPLSSLTRLDFSVGNITDLAELDPDTGDADPAVSLQPAAMTAKFGKMFKLSRLPPLGAEGFRIAGQRYDGGLSLHSPATLVYRVPEGFRKLHAVAGVDDSIVAPGNFVLLILGDGKELIRHEFSGSESRGPVAIDLDLTGIRRISIVLDPADGQDIGDQLNLCEARLTK